MARKVDDFPVIEAQSTYPWDEWLDGSIWELKPGVDFKGRSTTFRASAVTQASRRNGKVRTRRVTAPDGEETLYLQFYRPGAPSYAERTVAPATNR